MNWIFNLGALTIFMHIIAGIMISAKGLSNGKAKMKEFALAFGVTIAVSIFIFLIDIGEDKNSVVTCVEIGCIWIGSMIFRKVDRRMGLFVSIFYEFAVQLITLLTGASFIIVTLDKEYLDPFSMKGCIVSLVAASIILVVTIAIYLLKRVPVRFWLRVAAAMSIVSITCINYLTTIDIPELDKDEIYSWQYYALFILVAILVMQMRKMYDAEKELAKMKSEEAEMLEREYHALSQSYETNAKLFHDFRNHCGVLKNYLTKGKADEALSYLEELTGEGSTFSTEIWSGDETIDYLISSKKEKAESLGVTFEAAVEFPRNINIKSSDLCAILANLIDNAIEAASKVGSYEQHNENDGNSKDNRRVKLIIRRIQQMLVIKVENTYEIKPIVESGDYKTSKTDGGLHGWGIKSARTAAEKYDGMVQSSTTDDLFTTVVTLSFDGVKVSH